MAAAAGLGDVMSEQTENPALRVVKIAGLGAIYAFIFLPLVLVVAISFSDDTFLRFPPSGWSLRWYEALLANPKFLGAAGVSLTVALIVVAVSLAVGVPAAMALAKGRLPGTPVLETLLLSPLILPTIVLGLAILLVFSQFRLAATYPGLVLAHLTITLPFTVRILTTSLRNLPPDIEAAAGTLGAGPWQVFRYVTLPLLMPGVLAAAALSFILSFDEVVISLFVVGPRLSTLPVEIYRYVHERTDPFVAAVSVTMIVITTLVVLILDRTVGLMRSLGK
jgi:putative spermidine/putrescine transport system permease protein